ncbi:hypothetical protein EJ05DRAFT_443134 [Pseudovirgaria hyperparasitica]|uniref:Nuclear condensin complex subunit 3 C-terminal domain-containing protein n=1 Tax=Pseudovirgaria hyperparasitica TaxID=470096 RepID=A0A6A6VY52_9PEZI|nr:uncharacterized protein EJ05DRAFT_443134 [Pseudovirgaria hyperparasitica]KAF2754746.1 hypothetical protein EJ05DRAFT_443134 [Pseudovirgaria hyperparasitica]
MPARVGRASKTSAATRSRGSGSARTSANAIEIPDEGPTTTLRTRVCQIFADTARSTTAQRKLVVNLRKIQEACCYEPTLPAKKNKPEASSSEEDFNEETGRCLVRVLAIKKSEPAGDNVVRFITLFLKHASEKDAALAHGEDETTDFVDETPSTRLTTHVLKLALQVLDVKDKVVRFRATQIIVQIIITADSVDNDLFQHLRLGLLKRLRDKESSVRVQAAIGLCRLADDTDEDDEDDDSDDGLAGGILDKLLDVLQNDPSAEVRRKLLLNLPISQSTLYHLLERARDMDYATRKAEYARFLPQLDFRHISLTTREKLMRWGLRDRDENVRKAAARLFCERWIENCAGQPNATEDGTSAPQGQNAVPSLAALLELLERIDIVNSGTESGFGKDAMKEFWERRPDYREYLSFDDDFWSNLTPESAFVVRTLNDYCRYAKDSRLQELIEEKMPEVTKFAFFLKNHLNVFIEGVRKVASSEDTEIEEDTVQQEFCVEQMLHMALTFDYTDEVGRRKIFSIMREALALPELPEESTRLAIEVLRTVCSQDAAGEREFCAVVQEAMAEIRDTVVGEDGSDIAADDSFHSARSEVSGEDTPPPNKLRRSSSEREFTEADEEKAFNILVVTMKCLHLAQCMLQEVKMDLSQNNELTTMLHIQIIPAVQSHEAAIRERGIICLGLCCLQSRELAESNMDLLMHCFAKGAESLQVICLQVITDILIHHPTLFTSLKVAEEGNPNSSKRKEVTQRIIVKAYRKALLESAPAALRLNAVIGLSKLLLLHVLPAEYEAGILRDLIFRFFSPDTTANPGLQQALSYFLPVYCHSRQFNAVQIAGLLTDVIHELMTNLETNFAEEDFVGWTTIVGMLAEWTDGRRIVNTGMVRASQNDVEVDEPHVVLALDILERVTDSRCSQEECKQLLALLSKLYIPANATTSKSHVPSAEYVGTLQALNDLATSALSSGVAPDATSRTTLTKLQASLTKIVGEAEVVADDIEDEDQKSVATETSDGAPDEDEGNETEVPNVGDVDEDEGEDTEVPDENGAVMAPEPIPAVKEDSDTEMQDSEMVDAVDSTEVEHQEGAETMFGAPPEAEGTIIPEVRLSKRGRGRPKKAAPQRSNAPRKSNDESIVNSLLDSEM